MYRASQDQPRQQRQPYQQEQGEQSQQGGRVLSNLAPLTADGIAAIADDTGEDITLVQTGNWPGHSPSFVGVDRMGKPVIAAFHEVSITDRRVVPNENIEKIRNLAARNRSGQQQRLQEQL